MPRPDGARLWTTSSGTGPGVVLCHGGPGLWDYFAPLAALLDDRLTVVRYDQRGGGRSSGPGPYTVAQAIDDLTAVQDAAGLASCVVLGHSWGADLALRYAAARPSRCAAVLYVSGVGAGTAYRDGHRAAVADRLGPRLDRYRELSDRTVRTDDEERELCVLQWSTDYAPGTDGVAAAEHLWASRPPGAVIDPAVNRSLWSEARRTDLLTLASSVRYPVTMICGTDDPRPWQATDSLFAALPDVTRHVLADTGHIPWVESPEAVRTIVLDSVLAAPT